MKEYTKETLIERLKEIRETGWVKNARKGNDGGIGNTLEDLLGIEENNLPIPNANEWELKCQRANTSSLTTLFHMEPSPRAWKFVPNIFLLKYGWPHQKAGSVYQLTEMSFRQTIQGQKRSDRGFMVIVDRKTERVLVPKVFLQDIVSGLKQLKTKQGLMNLTLNHIGDLRTFFIKQELNF